MLRHSDICVVTAYRNRLDLTPRGRQGQVRDLTIRGEIIIAGLNADIDDAPQSDRSMPLKKSACQNFGQDFAGYRREPMPTPAEQPACIDRQSFYASEVKLSK